MIREFRLNNRDSWFLKIILTLLSLITAFGFAGQVRADNSIRETKTINSHIELSFEQKLDALSAGREIVEKNGGCQVVSRVSGKALELLEGEYLSVDLSKVITSNEGTISLWIRPHWGGLEDGSHTFLSFKWNDKKGGYFTLSKGWWEPKGNPFVYFVGNNQAYAHVHKQVLFEKGQWVHMACTWQGGDGGFIKLYVNGLLVAQGRSPGSSDMRPSGPLFLGIDKGTSMSAGRWAASDFDEIKIINRAMEGEEIYTLFSKSSPWMQHREADFAESASKIRAIFDEGTGWMTPTGAKNTIDRIKRAGFNMYFPCVWHGKGTRYPSQYAPAEPGTIFIAGDPLAHLIKIAHEQGIQVHPWFTIALRQKEFFPEFYGPGTPPNAFDLHRIEFRHFMASLIADVVERYDVDGINLDYIRTMGTCVCNRCVAAYKALQGRELLEDVRIRNTNGTLTSPLIRWHEEAVTDMVREISTRAHSIKPGITVSIDGHLRPSPDPEGRQEAMWANSGLIDLVFDMEYGNPPDIERHHLGRKHFVSPNKVVILLANYLSKAGRSHPFQAEGLGRNVEYVLLRWKNGVGLYLYSMLDEHQVDVLSKGPFRTKGEPPDLSLLSGQSQPRPQNLWVVPWQKKPCYRSPTGGEGVAPAAPSPLPLSE